MLACRVLGVAHLVLIGVGCIIGAGIVVLTGVAARAYAGSVSPAGFKY